MRDLVSPKWDKKFVKSVTNDLVLEVFDTKKGPKHPPIVFSTEEQKERHSNETLFTIDTEPKVQDNLDIPMYGKV